MPWSMAILVTTLVVFGVVYIGTSELEASPVLGDGRTIEELRGRAPARASAVDGGATYAAACAGCHQPTGQGLPGVFPPLSGTPSVAGAESRLIGIVLHGVTGSLTVQGSVYNGMMPGFKAQLSDEEVAAVLTHIRSQWGNAAPPISAAQVQQVREATSSRQSPFDGDRELGSAR